LVGLGFLLPRHHRHVKRSVKELTLSWKLRSSKIGWIKLKESQNSKSSEVFCLQKRKDLKQKILAMEAREILKTRIISR
jgi:hypothetical protein